MFICFCHVCVLGPGQYELTEYKFESKPVTSCFTSKSRRFSPDEKEPIFGKSNSRLLYQLDTKMKREDSHTMKRSVSCDLPASKFTIISPIRTKKEHPSFASSSPLHVNTLFADVQLSLTPGPGSYKVSKLALSASVKFIICLILS